MKLTARLLVLLFLLTLSIAAQSPISGTVVEVVGIDTVVLDIGRDVKFRIVVGEIETPSEEQELYETVREHLAKMLIGKTVYGRVTVGSDSGYVGSLDLNGVDVAKQLVRDGAAWYRPRIEGRPDPDFQQLEALAKAEKRGVWAIEGLLPPSRLRRAVQDSADPFRDPAISRAAQISLGPAVEDVFGREVYSIERSDCGGVVTGIVDGDTVRVRNGAGRIVTVRLAGIDAPERYQEGGQQAQQHLSSLLLGKPVSCESDKRDRYGRAVGKLSVGGQDVNLEMIRSGHAWHYREYASEQSAADRAAYAAAESSARAGRSGLWAGSPIRPSEFRKQQFTSLFRDPYPDNDAGFGPTYLGGSAPSSTRANGPVHVKGHYRSNGTYVQPHTRSRPRR